MLGHGIRFIAAKTSLVFAEMEPNLPEIVQIMGIHKDY